MSASYKIDDRMFVILAGFLAVGLQALSMNYLSPMVESAWPGFTKTAAHHMLVTALTLALPAAACFARTGSFSGRFADTRATLLWGGFFSLAIIGFNLGLMETASLIATGELHMPGIAAPQTGIPVFIAIVVLGPAAEEALYRGFILKTLMDRNSLFAAILMTSLLAILLHAVKYPRVEITYFIVKFVQSVIISLAYVKGRLGASTAVHVINNAAALMLF